MTSQSRHLSTSFFEIDKNYKKIQYSYNFDSFLVNKIDLKTKKEYSNHRQKVAPVFDWFNILTSDHYDASSIRLRASLNFIKQFAILISVDSLNLACVGLRFSKHKSTKLLIMTTLYLGLNKASIFFSYSA